MRYRIGDRMADWIIDRPWLAIVALTAGVGALLYVAVRADAQARARECAQLMTHAATPRDTLDVLLACHGAEVAARDRMTQAAVVGAAAAAVAAGAAGR